MDFTATFTGAVLITGGASGIGQATAVAFCEAGCRKFALIDLNEGGLKITAAQLRSIRSDASVSIYTGDLTSEDAVRKIVNQAFDDLGRIDFVVQSAGLNQRPRALLHETEMKNFDIVMAVNLRGLYMVQREVMRRMIRQEPTPDGSEIGRRGSIVNIASISAIAPTPNLTPYAASKAGVVALTRGDAQGYALRGIRINCICPGVVRTPMNESSIAAGEDFAIMVAGTPLKRGAQPKEIAWAALFLSHPNSSYIVGHSLVVDGGTTLSLMNQRKRKTIDTSQSPLYVVGEVGSPASDQPGLQQNGSDIPVSGTASVSKTRTTASVRAQRACVYCYTSKMRCLREPDGGGSCKRCLGAGIDCTTRSRKSYRIGPPRGQQKAGAVNPSLCNSLDSSLALNDNSRIDDSRQDLSVTFDFPEMPSSMMPALQDISALPLHEDVQQQTTVVPAIPVLSITSSLPVQRLYGETASDQTDDNFHRVSSSAEVINWDPVTIPSFAIGSSVNGQSAPTARVTILSPQSQQAVNSSVPPPQRRPTLQQESLLTTPLETLATVGAERSATDEQGGIAELRDLLNPTRAHAHIECVRPGPRGALGEQVDESNYFTPCYNSANLKYMESKDPISQYMLSVREAHVLFDLYWAHLQPLVAILDPHLHSMAAVRRTSTFLFTAILATAAKFAPDYDGIAHRLDDHMRLLAADTILQGTSSLEVVQGFCILCPWLDTGPHVSMDTTSTFLAIAYDRFKRLKPPVPQGDSLDQRRSRSYERTYLTLYNYDRGSALVSGVPLGFSLPEETAVSQVRAWAHAADAIEEDATLAALVTLRQNVPGVLQVIITGSPQSKENPNWMQMWLRSPAQISTVIREFLAAWKRDWLHGNPIDPYLSIVGHHTILSILVTALKEHMGRNTEAAMLVQAFLASMQTLQVFISAPLQAMKYLVNNTFVMVAYAAAFTLHALNYWQDSGSPIEASMYSMLSDAADRLISLGRDPVHRYGRSVIYGQRLRKRLQGQIETRRQSRQPSRQPSVVPEAVQQTANGHYEAIQQQQPFNPVAFDIVNMTFAQMDELLSSNLWRPLNDVDPLDSTLFDPGLGFLNLE